MHRVPLVLCLLCAFTGVIVCGAQAQSTGKSPTTFVGVQKVEQTPPCCYDGTDRPLTADAYEYHVAIKSGCTVYTGRYENFLDFFPDFKPGQAVNAEIGKHTIKLTTPGGDHLKMSIVDRSKQSGCSST